MDLIKNICGDIAIDRVSRFCHLLREKMDAIDHPLSSEPANPFLVVSITTVGSSSSEEPVPVAVDDGARKVTGINITVNGPVLATEVTSPKQSTNVAEKMVTTDPARLEGATDSSEDAEKSAFLRPRPQPSGDNPPHPFAWTSMFLPHPNAPKVVQQSPSAGPMYGRMTSQAYAYPSSTRQFPPRLQARFFFRYISFTSFAVFPLGRRRRRGDCR